MSGYVIGSVADIISNKRSIEVKPKKQKLKIKTQVEGGKGEENHESRDDIISPDSLKHNSKKKISSGKATFETPVEIQQNAPTESKPEIKVAKKRKKSVEETPNATETEGTSNSKKQKKDLLNLNHMSNFNKTEEESKRGEIPNQGKKFLKKQMDPEEYKKNTVFVGNIPITYDKKKVCKIFSRFGEIQSARIRCVPVADINMNKKVACIKKKYNPKRNSLVAYVRYKSEDSAKAALEANGMVIDGHHLRVDTAEENKQRDNSKAVFVGGLPFDIKDDELWEFFKNCGRIESVRVIRDSQTSMGKGFGYVNFDSSACVELALQLDGQELKKRAINVKRCMKIRTKNELNSFGRKKSKEIANNLLCKKGQKFKAEKKKVKKENKLSTDFQGRTANMKQKKKKKLSQTALRQRKLVKILGAS